MNLVRAFIAVEIPSALKEKLYRETAAMRRALSRPLVRWVAVSNIHLTLKFLGDTPLDELEKLKGFLSEEVAGFTPFEIDICGMGVFASFSRPRVIWAGVRDNGELASLHRCVEAAASRIGSEAERRRFSAHLTLARIRQGVRENERIRIRRAVEENRELNFGRIQVNSIHLFESKLKPTGAEYRSLFEASLAG